MSDAVNRPRRNSATTAGCASTANTAARQTLSSVIRRNPSEVSDRTCASRFAAVARVSRGSRATITERNITAPPTAETSRYP